MPPDPIIVIIAWLALLQSKIETEIFHNRKLQLLWLGIAASILYLTDTPIIPIP